VRRLTLLSLLAVTPAVLGAQSSQFGIRGLGYPGRGLGTHAIGSGGAFGLFDSESSQNPAALTGATSLTSVFTVARSFRSQENPAGTASARDTRFPHLMVTGPVRRGTGALGLSFSNYTSRDFTLASSSTVDIRGVPVGVTDTLSSRGGLNDLRLAGGWRIRNRWTIGAGIHVISGSNRMESQRSFADSSFVPSVQQAELSYAGVGVSAGLIRQFGPEFAVAAMIRSDGHLNVDRDSARVGTVDLPYSFGMGVRWKPSEKLDVATQGVVRTWSAANSDLLEQGGTGAANTFEIAAGAEYTPDPRSPSQRPLRLGARYGLLPFPLIPGGQGHEFGVSAGSGVRFGQQRGGLDVALEYVWRSEGVYSERAFILTLGISVRP
jgi:hypothetical protein